VRLPALLCIVSGAWLAAQPWLPEPARLARHVALPGAVAALLVPAGGALVALGAALLLIPRRRGAAASDHAIVATLTRHGFRFTPLAEGWQASGSWREVPMVLRRGGGREAARFGRPWVVVVSLPGRPAEPWPLHPAQGGVVDLRHDGFSVSLPDLCVPGQQDRLAERLDIIVASRHQS
jgi:hypothetical protein